MFTLEDVVIIFMLLTLKEFFVIAFGIFMSCFGATFLLCLTYWFVKMIDKVYYIDKSSPFRDPVPGDPLIADNMLEKREVETPREKPRPKIKKIEPTVSDDLPFSAPMKVESNFGDGQLGKQKE